MTNRDEVPESEHSDHRGPGGAHPTAADGGYATRTAPDQEEGNPNADNADNADNAGNTDKASSNTDKAGNADAGGDGSTLVGAVPGGERAASTRGTMRSAHRRAPRRRRPVLRGLVGLLVLATMILAVPNIWIWGASRGHIHVYGSEGDTARAPVAIVLGASVYPNGTPSPWLRYRLEVAAGLYESGRVDAILVSGDNGRTTYDEPSAMRDYLVKIGVPSEAVALDYAGFDTYGTCVRATKIFGIDEAIIVTQDFHEPRAVFACRSAGLQVEGVADTRARAYRSTWVKSWLRERLAAIKAVADVVTGRDPVLGRHETSVDDAVAWTRANRGKQ